MKLAKGTKEVDLGIPLGIEHSIERHSNGYIEIEIKDTNEITKLKAMGFKKI